MKINDEAVRIAGACQALNKILSKAGYTCFYDNRNAALSVGHAITEYDYEMDVRSAPLQVKIAKPVDIERLKTLVEEVEKTFQLEIVFNVKPQLKLHSRTSAL